MFLQFRIHHSIPIHGMTARRKNLSMRETSLQMERPEYGSVSDGESLGGKRASRSHESLDQGGYQEFTV